MNATYTRTGEALLAGAGYSVPHHQGCDFRLGHTANNEWQITVLSPRAQAWVSNELCSPLGQCLSDSFKVDILSADQFLKEARALGFRTEFVGRSGRDLF
ncbi:hypothetical protein CCGE525_33625 (plasmid) [Rhizobium jaguaris]|uniref:Uncharacterized protein n=1 Tax=Rhizobium jaguaris TaxID=1312183 RepID=A0A387G239_9HYPH|nr:hypothetical protein CCGE525_33625 [Rhizobium jaguaris]